MEPSRTLTEEYGVIVGHTLVDASSRSASVFMVNPNAEEVMLPSFTCVGKLVSVSAISVALADPGLPHEEHATLPDHLEEIVTGSHPSLGESGVGCYFVSSFIVIDMFFRWPYLWTRNGRQPL